MRHIWIHFVMMALLLASCSSNDLEDVGSESYKPIGLKKAAVKVNQTVNDFSAQFACEALSNTEGNALVAPFSMQVSLSMLANAANANTLKEVMKVMGFEGQQLEDINAYNQQMWQSLKTSDPSATFCMANGLWARFYDEDYAALMKQDYNAEVAYAPLVEDPDACTDMINNYFNQATGGLIPKAIEKAKNADGLLYNVMYFKNKWTHQFDKAATTKRDFHNADKSVSQVDMMSQTAKLESYANSDYTYVRLPFGNGAFSFDIILPESQSLDECLAQLKTTGLPSDDKMEVGETTLILPKFEAHSTVDGKTLLEKMGISDLFYDVQSLPLIGNSCVSSIEQNCKMKIDEEGGEASVVTESAEVIWSAHLKIIDHPFIYMIREKSTGVILLAGKIEKM